MLINEEDVGEEGTELLKQVIKFVQNNGKQYRTGLQYTKLLDLSIGYFKIPNIWLSTTMCLCEWNMLDKLFENSGFY